MGLPTRRTEPPLAEPPLADPPLAEPPLAEPTPAAAGPSWPVRLAVGAGEVLAGFAAAAGSLLLSMSIMVDPLDRVGQVSGVAGLDLRFVVLGLLVLAACVVAARGSATTWAVVSRCACAAVAGLATGLVGAGILLALRGTQWPLFAFSGDSGQLIAWAEDLRAGRPIPADYPPVVIHVIAGLAELMGTSTAEALRAVQVLGTAVFGPISYLFWRLRLSPTWALAVTLVAALPLLEPYKSYTTVVLVATVAVLVAFLGALRNAQDLAWARVAVLGVATGACLGALFLVYSGWFVWSAPGALVVTLVVFPWRRAALRGLALVGLTGVCFAAVAAPHLIGLLASSGTVQDRFFYFDTYVDPAYIAMWRNDLPGDVGPWPPPGELGGVGVFTVLLVIGLGAAVALGGRRTAVLAVCSLMAGSWLMRFWFASQMYATGTVQLYPRTTAEILFCLLLLWVLAARLGVDRLRLLAERWELPAKLGNGDDSPARRRAPGAIVTIGVLCAGLLLALSIGSSVADRFMARDDNSVGLLAYVAQMVRQPDGTCPRYSVGRCAASPDELLQRDD